VDKKTRVKWWEPYGATLRSGVADLRSAGVLRAAFWVRVVIISAAVVGVVIGIMLFAYPGMWLPWWQLATGLLIWPAVIAFLMGLSMLAPRHVEVRCEWVQFTHGQSAVRILAPDIRSVALVQREGSGLRLRLDYVTRRGVRRTRECAVSSAIDRDTLDALIADLAEEASRHASPPDRSGF
jgi:hypothetical protein